MKKKRIQLVDDWKYCRKWLSVKLSVLGTVSCGLWLYLPALQSAIPQNLLTLITMGLFLMIGIGRVIDQGSNARRKK